MRLYKVGAILTAALLLPALAACGHKGNSNVTTQSAGAGQSANSGGTVIVAAGTDFTGKLQQPIGS